PEQLWPGVGAAVVGDQEQQQVVLAPGEAERLAFEQREPPVRQQYQIRRRGQPVGLLRDRRAAGVPRRYRWGDVTPARWLEVEHGGDRGLDEYRQVGGGAGLGGQRTYLIGEAPGGVGDAWTAGDGKRDGDDHRRVGLVR